MSPIKTIGVMVGISAIVAFAVMALTPKAVTTVVQEKLGSVASPDIPSPYLNWGGIRMYNTGTKLTQGTTTVCSIQSPVSTSTLEFAGIQFDFASSSALVLDIGQGTTPYSTSSARLSSAYNIAANAFAFIQASTSPGGVGTSTFPGSPTAMVFPPSTYLNFKFYGNGTNLDTALSVASLVPVGRCQAQFIDYTPR